MLACRDGGAYSLIAFAARRGDFNQSLPVVTYLAMSLADIVASSIIVEQVFVVPGLGRLLVASISNRDYPVALCIVVMIASVVVVMNYLADILTQAVDPRVRLS